MCGDVSIHAPPNRKERRLIAAMSFARNGFNPRPSQPEGATLLIRSYLRPIKFQSTPLPTGRSDDVHIARGAGNISVSIHAPPNRKERLPGLTAVEIVRRFQSTPLPTGRSDAAKW